jgi:cysteate synthase
LCGLIFDDDGLVLRCPADHSDALLRTEYPAVATPVFDEWLPAVRPVDTSAFSVAYRADRLAAAVGLKDLWVTFSGYWPERGANAPTCTFKDFEAAAVLGRLPLDAPILVVASAGNTAAAFLHACRHSAARCLVIVPENAHDKIDVDGKPPNVTYVMVCGDATYADAKTLAGSVSQGEQFQAEGGVLNVARRDGLARCFQLQVATSGSVPDLYVQGVGSAAGALGSYESALRMRQRLPRMVLAQNAPRAAVVDRWRKTASTWQDKPIVAMELSNESPPYDLPGGIKDMLEDTAGSAVAVSNSAVLEAMRLFDEIEGIDIEPAAGVALAALGEAVRAGQVVDTERVHLNITGGGRLRKRAAGRGRPVVPDLTIDARELRDPVSLRAATERVVKCTGED